MNLWSQNFSQKTNKKLQGFLPWEVGQKFLQSFVCFLGEVLARQFCFEINWPLGTLIESWDVRINILLTGSNNQFRNYKSKFSWFFLQKQSDWFKMRENSGFVISELVSGSGVTGGPLLATGLRARNFEK